MPQGQIGAARFNGKTFGERNSVPAESFPEQGRGDLYRKNFRRERNPVRRKFFPKNELNINYEASFNVVPHKKKSCEQRALTLELATHSAVALHAQWFFLGRSVAPLRLITLG